jgi:glycosyl transferase, family 25
MLPSTPFAPPLFVINLERSHDRRAHVTAQLEALGLACEVFPATDGAQLSAEELARYDESFVIEQIARPMSGSEVGCYLSHTRLWQTIIDQSIPWAVVLEDDVTIHAELKSVLSAISRIPVEWDLIRLAGLGPTPALELCGLDGQFRLSTLLKGASGTQAICISRSGAQKLLAHALPRIRGTIDDHVIDNCWRTGLRILAVQPYPIHEDKQFVSSIEKERRRIFQENRKKAGKTTFRKWVIRRRYKLGRSIGKRAFVLIHAWFWVRWKIRTSSAEKRSGFDCLDLK